MPASRSRLFSTQGKDSGSTHCLFNLFRSCCPCPFSVAITISWSREFLKEKLLLTVQKAKKAEVKKLHTAFPMHHGKQGPQAEDKLCFNRAHLGMPHPLHQQGIKSLPQAPPTAAAINSQPEFWRGTSIHPTAAALCKHVLFFET